MRTLFLLISFLFSFFAKADVISLHCETRGSNQWIDIDTDNLTVDQKTVFKAPTKLKTNYNSYRLTITPSKYQFSKYWIDRNTIRYEYITLPNLGGDKVSYPCKVVESKKPKI